MRVKKIFEYEGIKLRIIEREEDYMNSSDTVTMVRVLAPNNGVIPMQIQHKQTLKSIVSQTIDILNGFKDRGCDVKDELTKIES